MTWPAVPLATRATLSAVAAGVAQPMLRALAYTGTRAPVANPPASVLLPPAILMLVWPASLPYAVAMTMAGSTVGASTTTPFAVVLYLPPSVAAATEPDMTITSLVGSAASPSSRTVVV